MKKLLAGIVGLALVAGIAQAQTTLVWSGAGIVDLTGTPVTGAEGWMVQMYEGASLPAAGTPGAAPLAGITATINVPGGFANGSFDLGADGIGGKSVYTVVYNAASAAAATHFTVLPDSLKVLDPQANPPAPIAQYAAGGNTVQNWQRTEIIPEPSTIADRKSVV